MSEKSHLRITRPPDVRRYKFARAMGGGGEFPLPPRDRLPHAAKLTTDLLKAAEAGRQTREEQGLTGRPKAFVYTFRSDPGKELMLDGLERRQHGIELQSVHFEGDVQVAAVRVPDGELRVFFNLVKAYQKRIDKRSGTYKNKSLVESIAGIRLAAIRDLWQDPAAFPATDQAIWWEVWVRAGPGGAKGTYLRFRDLAASAALRVSEQYIAFPERVVTLAFGTQLQMGGSLDLLTEVAELRRAKELASDYMLLPPRCQREYIEDAVGRVVPPPKNAPSVCLLDTGVNRGHPLIAVALDEADLHAVRPDWGVADHHGQQHGTTMAGISLYGCLTEIFNSSGPYPLRHRLESVKLLPPFGRNAPDLYGALTQEGVARAEVQAPMRNRAVCLTITSDSEDQALPSSWSAAIDQMCSGELDNQRRLVFVAAGNVRDEILHADYEYHTWNSTKAGVEDPGQSWNAVTVGAMTEKVFITDPQYRDWRPVAARSGDLCPASRTSLAWPRELHPGWPLKPDIVMEGGNYAEKDGDRIALDDLSLLTTVVRPDGRRLETTSDTSPATAAAARLGALIWSHYPRLWPETVRGLMVHSARWTGAMEERFPGDKKSTVEACLRCYGYGVPRLSRALWSAGNAVTMIFEGDLQPYDMVEGEVGTKEMHVHELPWPRQALLGLGGVELTMRVTLSYFVEPSPGRIGWQSRHRYQSYGLRFDVIRPLEDEAQFRQRVSRAEWAVPDKWPQNVGESRNWVVGENGRTHGSLHCDWWEGSAAELADSNRIVVYPVTGWWRERAHLERWSRRARYSLIVSVETPRVEVDLYSLIAAEAVVETEVES